MNSQIERKNKAKNNLQYMKKIEKNTDLRLQNILQQILFVLKILITFKIKYADHRKNITTNTIISK